MRGTLAKTRSPLHVTALDQSGLITWRGPPQRAELAYCHLLKQVGTAARATVKKPPESLSDYQISKKKFWGRTPRHP